MTIASKQVVSCRIQAERKGSILKLFRVARIFTRPGFDCAIVLVSSAHNLFLTILFGALSYYRFWLHMTYFIN